MHSHPDTRPRLALRVVSDNPNPRNSARIRVLVNMKLHCASTVQLPQGEPALQEAQDMLQHALKHDSVGDTHLHDLMVTQAEPLNNGHFTVHYLQAHAYHQVPEAIHDESKLQQALDDAEDKLEELKGLLAISSPFKILTSKFYIAPLANTGFPLWLHNKIVMQRVASTLRL